MLDARTSLPLLDAPLAESIRLVDSLIGAFVGHPGADIQLPPADTLSRVVRMLLQSMGSSTETLRKLSATAGLHTRDCYSIARSVLETAVNAGFIMVEGDAMADRMETHAHQKSYRDLQRDSAIGTSRITAAYSATPTVDSVPGLAEDLAAFSARSGRERTQWIDLSIDERIESIGAKCPGLPLTYYHLGRFAIYRHSSEILHGTLFGALYPFGYMEPGPRGSLPECEKAIAEKHRLILISTMFMIIAVALVFGSSFNSPITNRRAMALAANIRTILGVDAPPSDTPRPPS